MSQKSLSALIILAFILVCTPVWAQLDDPGKSFPLSRDGAETDEDSETAIEELEIWTPQIKQGDFAVSLMVGYLDLNKTILSHDQIIYKWIREEVLWGDVDMKGTTSFNTSVRAGYNVTQWLCIEGLGGFSVGDCSTTAENRGGRSNEINSSPYATEPALGEFDLENRSLLTIQAGLNAVVYPLNFTGDAEGRFHPYVSGSVGRMWFSMNSNYSDEPTADMSYTLGGGMRFLVDKVVSIRFEMNMNRTTVTFDPRENFEEFEEGTLLIPLEEYPFIDDALQVTRVKEFGSQSNTFIGYSLGVQITF